MTSDWRVERIPVTSLASGAELQLALHELRGRRGDGPTLGLSAGIHGDEAIGVEILFRMRQRLDARELRGRVLMLPCANPLSYAAITRNTPLDMTNLNRVFPGDPQGWFTEQLADRITTRFLGKVDALVDLHAGGAYPTVDYVYIINDEGLSRAFGSPWLYRPRDLYPGTATGITRARNVPSIVVELGGGDIDQSEYVARGLAGITNVMQRLEMLPGSPAQPPPQTVLTEIATIRPRTGGLLIPEVTTLGIEVGPDTVLGRIHHPQTFEQLEAIRPPYGRGVTILLHRTANVVEPGSYGYMIGNLDSAEG
jgi:predicted deacylase